MGFWIESPEGKPHTASAAHTVQILLVTRQATCKHAFLIYCISWPSADRLLLSAGRLLAVCWLSAGRLLVEGLLDAATDEC